MRIVHTFSQSLCTSVSANCLHVIKLSIHPSRVGIEAGSEAGDNLDGSGARPTSSILVSMMFGFLVAGGYMLKRGAFRAQ